MKVSKGESNPANHWQKTQYANLIRYVPSGTYFARLRVRGKLIRRSLKTDVISVAKLRLSDLEKSERAAAESLKSAAAGKMAFSDALEIFQQRIAGSLELKPRTKAYYSERIDALLKSWPDLERRKLRDITERNCENWAAKFGLDSSPVAFNHTVGILRRVFEIGIKEGACYVNPARVIGWATEKPKKLRLPEPSQFEGLVKAIENCGWVYGKDSADMVQFLAFTGLRKTEARFVTWRDCNFEKGEILVRGHPETGTKNSEERRVPMIPDTRQLLEGIRSERPDEPPDTPVIRFLDCRKALANACDRIGIPKLTHHDLRHLFATRCIEAGVDIPTVSRWLGHKDGGALAMKTYGHLRDTHSAEMAQRVTFASKPAQANIVPLAGRHAA
ncbi:MAG: site-specific integrase [Verrucomicrobia bacterium]|nr:site-specific integrase [Verrucomicrobiota bacterium]